VFAAHFSAQFSSKPDRAYFVGSSFDGKDENGETACNMCGKLYKSINIHRTEKKSYLILFGKNFIYTLP